MTMSMESHNPIIVSDGAYPFPPRNTATYNFEYDASYLNTKISSKLAKVALTQK